jgi:hypothetical protein
MEITSDTQVYIEPNSASKTGMSIDRKIVVMITR